MRCCSFSLLRPFCLLATLFTLGTIAALGGIALTCLAGDQKSHAQDQSVSKQDPLQLMREVVNGEIHTQAADHSLWSHVEIREHHGAQQKIEFIQTPQGELHRLLAINGRPLDGQQAAKETARIEKVIHHPEIFEKRAQDSKKDDEQEDHFLEMLPLAFRYRVVSRNGDIVELAFTPNPAFKPQRREGQVFREMVGNVWVDRGKKYIVKMQGRLINEVKFGDGLLGHLDKGGTFLVEQKDLGNGHWVTTRLDVHMVGKALFFKNISVQQSQSNFGYKPVPNMTLAQAVELLKQNARAEKARARRGKTQPAEIETGG